MIHHSEIKLKKMKNFIFEENEKRNFASFTIYFPKKLKNKNLRIIFHLN